MTVSNTPREPWEVVWVDSAQLERGDWMTVEDAERYADDLEQTSVGYVVAETDVSLVLARSASRWVLDSVEKVEGVLCIPKACIVSRHPLERVVA